MFVWFRLLVLVGSVAVVAACGGSDDEPARPPQPPGTLAEVAAASGFTALVAAADKAGLVPALREATSDLTVFAPTDAAFASLAATLGFANASAMVAGLDAATLASILQYHVLPARQTEAQLRAGGTTRSTLYSFAGAATELTLDTSAGVKITDEVLTQATVVTADVAASNGVIHVIDKVLVPPGVLNIVLMAQLNPAFSTLVEGVVAADLAGSLGGAEVFTVFAPTNDAFAAALAELRLDKAHLLASDNLAGILAYHMVPGSVRAADVAALTKPAQVTTVQGSAFTVNNALRITDGRGRSAGLVATDVIAANGVIHVIDQVILPAP